MTWDGRFYFPSEGRRAEDFFALKTRELGVPKASTLSLDHGSRLQVAIQLDVISCTSFAEVWVQLDVCFVKCGQAHVKYHYWCFFNWFNHRNLAAI
jgi:hypothetical protein